MTTVTEKAVEAIESATQQIEEAVEVIAEVEHARWKGNIVSHQLSSRAESIAAALAPLVTENEKGMQAGKKVYYQVAEKHGYDPKVLKDIEEFNSDYAHGFHAVASDKALTRFRDNAEASTFEVRGDIGERTRYTDTYKRHYERSVSGGPERDRVIKADFGYHSPSIKTEYKGFNESRQVVHNLARELLG